jgi:hypothetical protein
MLAKGPELRLEVLPGNHHQQQEQQEPWVVRLDVFKSKKQIFKDDIALSQVEGHKLQYYLGERVKAQI